jgi:hypothetical protein
LVVVHNQKSDGVQGLQPGTTFVRLSIGLPEFLQQLRHHTVVLVGHFEQRWRTVADNWKCALDALDLQITRQREAPVPAPRLGVIRFVDQFPDDVTAIEKILHTVLAPGTRQLAFLKMETLLLQFRQTQNPKKTDILRIVLHWLPLYRWGMGVLVVDDYCLYVSITPSTDYDTFQRVLQYADHIWFLYIRIVCVGDIRLLLKWYQFVPSRNALPLTFTNSPMHSTSTFRIMW